MRVRTITLSGILILAIAGSWWLTSNIHINKYSAGIPDSGPDSYGFNITLTSTNDKGQLASYFTTPKMVQYTKSNLTEITEPRIILYSDKAPPKRISANYAKSQGNKSIKLWGNVIIHQGNLTQLTTIKTSTLTFYPKQNIAKTISPVTILEPTSFTQAVGFMTDLNTGEMQLLSKVRTIYN